MKHFCLLSLLLCLSCQPESVKVVNLTDCNQQRQVSSSAIVSRSLCSVIEMNCEDLSQYKCDIREFSPTIPAEIRKDIEYCPVEGRECLSYDHQIFDTSDQKQVDEYALPADFEKGGQYNRQEIRCWNQFKKSKVPSSESLSLKDALKAAYEFCKQ